MVRGLDLPPVSPCIKALVSELNINRKVIQQWGGLGVGQSVRMGIFLGFYKLCKLIKAVAPKVGSGEAHRSLKELQGAA